MLIITGHMNTSAIGDFFDNIWKGLTGKKDWAEITGGVLVSPAVGASAGCGAPLAIGAGRGDTTDTKPTPEPKKECYSIDEYKVCSADAFLDDNDSCYLGSNNDVGHAGIEAIKKRFSVSSGADLKFLEEHSHDLDLAIYYLESNYSGTVPPAIRTLISFGPNVVPSMIQLIIQPCGVNDDYTLMGRVSTVLKGIGADATLPALAKLLEHPDDKVRSRVMMVLEDYGSLASPTVPKLIAVFGDRTQSEKIRLQAAEVLLKVSGSQASAVAPVMIDIFRDKTQSEEIRFKAAKVLESYGSLASPTVPDLITVFRDKTQSEEIRFKAAIVLGEIGPQSSAFIPDLLPMIRNHNLYWRGDAIEVLGRIGGPQSFVAVPDLLVALEDPSEEIRGEAVLALGKMGLQASAAILPSIIRKLYDPSRSVRHCALEALGIIGPAASAAEPAIINRFLVHNDQERFCAVVALGKIGLSQPSVSALNRVLINDRDLEIRAEAAKVLGNKGHTAPSTVPGLIRALEEPYIEPRSAYNLAIINDQVFQLHAEAVKALGNMGPAAASAVPALIRALEDPYVELVGIEAVKALGNIGPAAKAAVPSLLAFRNKYSQHSEIVAREVDSALAKIQQQEGSN